MAELKEGRNEFSFAIAVINSPLIYIGASIFSFCILVHGAYLGIGAMLKQDVKVGDQLQESGENVFVGGKNRWKYSTFVNWELWWPNFPVLVYFKEKQSKPEGQVHFFPVIFDGKQLYDVMVERCGPSQTSSPK